MDKLESELLIAPINNMRILFLLIYFFAIPTMSHFLQLMKRFMSWTVCCAWMEVCMYWCYNSSDIAQMSIEHE